jgi:hypothetical protein
MDTAAQRAFAAQRAGSIALAAIVVLSLLSSVLIVWLYVGRNIVSRPAHLSAAMAAIAGGRRDITINHEGADKIAAIGRSVEVLCQNAIERDTHPGVRDGTGEGGPATRHLFRDPVGL